MERSAASIDRRATRDASADPLWLPISHGLLCLSLLLCWAYFFLLNRTRVTGRPRRIARNTLFVSNHQSSIDSLLIATATLLPGCLVRPWSMPWNLAIAEHFYRTPFRSWCSDHLRCIPVTRELDDWRAFRRMTKVLPHGVAIFYPEGRRSADGAVGEAHDGVGALVLAARPLVIPVAIEGLREAVRFDRFGLRFFRPITISFGEPLDFGTAAGTSPRARARGDLHLATEQIMERVRRLHAGIRRSGEGA